MDTSRKIIALPVCAVMCTGVTSCKRPNTQTAEKNDGSEGQPEGGGKNVLSKEQIIKIADAEARRRSCDPETHNVFYDEGNSHWRTRAGPAQPVTRNDAEAAILDQWPELKGHGYQAVEYMLPLPKPGGTPPLARPSYILVDRNTSEVLLAEVFSS